ncbi:MAG: alanine racemase [Planctomycetes bacterium]|nr:alanine racemase [Planctomycetota bacterium]
MKRPYEKPFLMKLQSRMMNKHGFAPGAGRRVRKAIDGVKISDLVDRYGSPLFVYSERTLRRKYRQMHSAFTTRYPNVVFGWSYKTNYLKAICAIMHQEGAYAEIVSKMEYEKAKGLGIAGDRIIFNGPHKPLETLAAAVVDGVTINIDHLDEINDLEHVADRLGRTINVGIRLNMDVGIHPQWSRFGFNLESGQAIEAVRRISRGGKLKLTGLHCHIGTFITDETAYARQVEKLVAFAYQVQAAFGYEIESLDIGGGFASRSKLKGTYLSPDVSVPTIEDYAEQICDALRNSLRPGHFPTLVVEAGRAMVDEAGYLITTVQATKRLADGTRAYVADAGINLLFTSFWYKFHVEVDRDVSGANEHSVIYGPMCMNIDAIDDGLSLPPLERGHRLIFSPVGAYNNTQWLQFIEYRPNVVLVSETGEVELIRRHEDLSDIERREVLPLRLIPELDQAAFQRELEREA